MDFITEFIPAYSPLTNASIKSEAKDFIVNELLHWNFTGSGEHLYYRIKKTGLNTRDAIKKIAKHLACPVREVGYAGLKDKHAVTTQWVSVPVKYQVNDFSSLRDQSIEILECHRHSRKLRQGNLHGNAFIIRVYHDGITRAQLSQRLKVITHQGFPNYFGQQRFGADFRNLQHALTLLQSQRKEKLSGKNGFYLSCLRSYLFNLLLLHRVKQHVWQQLLAGDILQLAGTQSVFVSDTHLNELQQRIYRGDIQVAGPLWGTKRLQTRAQAYELEKNALASVKQTVRQIESLGIKAGYRAYVARPRYLNLLEHNYNNSLLAFELGPGQYATELLKNIFHLLKSRKTEGL